METAQVSQQNRLLVFANVFKGYMGVMPLVTAALAPLLTALNVIPTYDPQRKPLATIAGVLGFLLVAWLFYVRRTIALGSITRGYRTFFNFLPLLLIGGSIGCYVGYAHALDNSLADILAANPLVTRTQALGAWTMDHAIPGAIQLQLLYLGMFLFAEAAFVMMALREYANDVQGVSEYQWMFGEQDGSSVKVKPPTLTQPVAPVVSGQSSSGPDPAAPAH
jgi:hypothetical protein